jgi:hypothetical protein
MRVACCGAIQGSLDWILPRITRSGRSAAWLARLVRDQEVDGSNPFAPTTSSRAPLYSPSVMSFIDSRRRTTRNLFLRTITSAARGREL